MENNAEITSAFGGESYGLDRFASITREAANRAEENVSGFTTTAELFVNDYNSFTANAGMWDATASVVTNDFKTYSDFKMQLKRLLMMQIRSML